MKTWRGGRKLTRRRGTGITSTARRIQKGRGRGQGEIRDNLGREGKDKENDRMEAEN